MFSNIRWLLQGAMLVYVVLAAAYSRADGEEVEGGEQPAAASAIYLPIKPAFVVNYGGVGPLKYIKAEVSVRLSSAQAADGVRHHLPYIRNNLVMLFARQTNETLDSQVGKEALRRDALAEVRKILLQEDGVEDGVVDVYFNTLIIQK